MKDILLAMAVGAFIILTAAYFFASDGVFWFIAIYTMINILAVVYFWYDEWRRKKTID